MINWDDLRFCLALHRHGTMVNAAKSLKANVATVSRRIEHITTDVGETLFIRNGMSGQQRVSALTSSNSQARSTHGSAKWI
jgi:DNA-binding transcriptional LysR family regulator